MNNIRTVHTFLIDKGNVLEKIKYLKELDSECSVLLIEGRSKGNEPGSAISNLIKEIKKLDSVIKVYCDLCVCSETTDSHCRLTDDNGSFDMEKTQELILYKARKFIEAGVDWLVLSDMNLESILNIRDLINGSDSVKIAVEYKLRSNLYNVFRSRAGMPQITKDYHAEWPSEERLLSYAKNADAIVMKPALLSADLYPVIKRDFPSIPIMSFITSGEAMMVGYIENEYKASFLPEMLDYLKRLGTCTVFVPQVFAGQK